MLEVDDELREIKREVIEARGLIIKTNNLTNALSADIKSIAKRQQATERRFSLNSWTSYVVFVVAVFVALKFAWDARIDAIRAETQGKAAEYDRMRRQMREAQRREEDRTRAETKGAAFYELVRQAKWSELVAAYDGIRNEPVAPTEQAVFADAVDRAKGELAAQLYLQGVEKARLQRWQEAAAALEEALRYKDDSAVAPAARLALGEAYRRLGRQKDAIPLLSQAADDARDRELQDDALYHLAWSQAEMGAWNDAKSSWRALLRRFPESRFTKDAKGQLWLLSRSH